MPITIPKIGFISLGCPKALVDSEQILTQLRAEGYEVSPSFETADLVIINTCGFIDEAVKESYETIEEALQVHGQVIVTGCLGTSMHKLREDFPELLAVTGPHATQEVMAAVHAHAPQPHAPFTSLVPEQGVKLTPDHYAYLKISEGCNHSCRFCIIPKLRGKLISRPMHEIAQEAHNLARAGVKELLVIAQDTSAYGLDLNYRMDFWQGRPVKSNIASIANALGDLGMWIRMHYLYPYPHVDELVELMADGVILPYLDTPLQHASPSVLKAMKRPANTENVLARIRSWREICPDIALRSTFIVGFPGETETDFNLLLQFLQETQLDRVGCFPYSAVEGAEANKLPGAVPEEVKQERLERLMELQAAISADKLERRIGQEIQVLVDEVTEEEIIARSGADAPEVDGVVYVDPVVAAKAGDFLLVRVTDSDDYDLYAEPVKAN